MIKKKRLEYGNSIARIAVQMSTGFPASRGSVEILANINIFNRPGVASFQEIVHLRPNKRNKNLLENDQDQK